MTTESTPGGPESAFLHDLVESGLLLLTGVPGVYGRGHAFESVADGIDALVTEAGRADGPEVVRFPPLLSRGHLERSEYLESFPNLAGSLHSFEGDERAHRKLLKQVDAGDDWTGSLTPTELVLTPAACYPVYPTVSGTLPEGGRLFDLSSYCFRHEPSTDPARMQMFRMHEYVRLGDSDTVREWRDRWLARGQALTQRLGLTTTPQPASDPFFGRAGQLLARSQRDQGLKTELVVPIAVAERPTAVVSVNLHRDHFGRLFDIRTSRGEVAHSACIGFGLERLTLALFKAHGLHPAKWPPEIYASLRL
jgi:seryl-tRNA synthetase